MFFRFRLYFSFGSKAPRKSQCVVFSTCSAFIMVVYFCILRAVQALRTLRKLYTLHSAQVHFFVANFLLKAWLLIFLCAGPFCTTFSGPKCLGVAAVRY